ncbi:ankyrin repeat domain-containing protein [Criblamydia sequanensis]|uniref:Ankyrin repeat-containing protein n=1 Tax=Candidatus Criblamydia sequanensis CRIB-18 TaxID=1437425 RepID=A0A090D094_9BACT|nr:ankyrin repeat domain-containing protein [Criblamydia sequanensis]CDR33220.1 Ankyrin repeat-containing protein [Criblamydia sequanensis CRIB-18]
MSYLAWDASKDLFINYNVDSLHVVEKDHEFDQLDFRAKINDRVLHIKVKLQSKDDLQEEDIKETVIDLANQINKLVLESEEKDVFSATFDGHVIQTFQSSWNHEKSLSTKQKFSTKNERIHSFEAEVDLADEELKKVQDLFQTTLSQPDLKKDLDRLFKAFSNKRGFFFSKAALSTRFIQEFIEAFQKIDSPTLRNSVIEIVKQESNDWLPCVLMILESGKKNSSPMSWKSLLACCSDSPELYQEILKRGININAKDPKSGSTLLMAAISMGYKDLALSLVKHCEFDTLFAINKKEESALLMAFRQGYLEIFQEFMKIEGIREGHLEAYLGKDCLQSFLTVAIEFDHLPIVKELLSLKSLDVNRKSRLSHQIPLELAISKNHVEIARELLKNKQTDLNARTSDGSSLLEKAFTRNDSRILEEFFARGDIDIRPLFSLVEAHPRYASIPQMEILSRYFKKESEDFFQTHPAIKMAQLYIQGQQKEAQELLNANLGSNNKAFNITHLLKAGEGLDPFIEKNKTLICKWLLEGQILENLPQEDQIFVLSKFYPKFYQFMDAAGTLSQKGIAIVIESLKNKDMPSIPPEESITLCQDRPDFEDALVKLACNDTDIKEGDVRLFIVNASDDNPHGIANHVTPLFFKRVENAWEIIITDSTTDYSNCKKTDGYCAPLVDIILNMEKYFVEFSVRHIHVNTFWRQTDDRNCFVFAISDLINFTRLGDQFLSSLPKTKQKVHYFRDLPLKWMKTTQSISEIKRYAEMKKSGGESLLMSRRKGKKDETLLENLSRHTKKAASRGNREENFLIEDRSKKYKQMVINRLIANLKEIYKD